MKISNYSLTTKLIIAIIISILLLAAIIFLYISQSVKENFKEIEKEQIQFLEQRIKNIEKNRIENELKTIKLYSQALKGAISEALYNLEEDTIEEILTNFMKIKSVKSIYIYDYISNKPIINMIRKKGKIITLKNLQEESIDNQSFFKYTLKTSAKDNIGYMLIFYDTDYIVKNAQIKTDLEMKKIGDTFKDKLNNLQQNRFTVLLLFSLFLIFVITVITFTLNRYMKKPLHLLYANLNGFFDYLNNPHQNFTPKPYNSQDEFGVITQKLNESIKNAVKLHKNLSYFMDMVDKNVPIIQCNKEGKFIYISEEFCKLTGYTKYELLGENHGDFLSTKRCANIYVDYVDNWEKEIELIRRYRKKDGSVVIFSSILSFKYNENKQVSFTEILHDITYEKELISLQKEMQNTQKEILFTIGGIAEERSHETGDHIKRVAAYTEVLAKHTNLSERKIKLLRDASPMHDVGKIAIPDSILLKPGKLSPKEFDIMKSHAQIGYDMLKHSKRPLLKTAAIIARTHHEKFDGTGYPRGLKGKHIHIYGRIVAIADVFDALGSDRVYKKAWEDEKIFKFFKEQSGKHFDPELVDIFFQNIDELLEIRDKYKQ